MSVIFDQLRISDDGKTLYVDMHVNKSVQFENVYLDSITIIPAMDAKGELLISETSPHIPTDNYIYNLVFDGNYKEASLTLSNKEFNEAFNNTNSQGKTIKEGPTAKLAFGSDFGKNLYFVYVKYKGMPDDCLPCCLKPDYTLGVTFDIALLYQLVMQYTRQLSDTCKIAKGFLDLILLWNGFKAALETEHYIPAIEFWKKIFWKKLGAFGINPKPCGCHG